MKKLYLLLILLTALVTGQGLQTGLIAYYPFNGNANDASGNGNNGVVNGATLTTDKNGNPNSAYLFNGSSNFINIPNEFAAGQSLSLSSFRVKFKLNQSGDYGLWNKDGSWKEVSIRTWSDNSIGLHCAYPSQYNGIRTNPNTIMPNAWYDVVFVVENNSGKIYINGVQQQSYSTLSIPSGYISFSHSGSCGVGYNRFGFEKVSCNPVHYLNGIIDEYRLYNRALSYDEVTELYNLDLPTLQTGLIAYYPFNGNANDESGSNYHGTVNGASLVADRFSNTNKAYSFDGSNDFIQVNNQVIPSNTDFTISLWVYMRNTASTQEFLSQQSWPGGFYVGLQNNQYRVGDCWQSTGVAVVSSQWLHITVKRKYNGISDLFINGVKRASTSANLCINESATDSLRFGKQYSSTEFFNGYLDDIRIYNRSLSDAEILGLYNLESGNTPPNLPPYIPTNGLVGWWPFNGNANDESGNGNNGAVIGSLLASDRFGNNNKAYSFNGVNCCGTPDSVQEIAINNNLINLSHNYSVSIWMKSVDISKYQQLLLNSIPHPGFAVEFNNEHVPGRLSIGVGNGSGWDATYVQGNNTSYANNSWYHVVFIKDGTNYKVYLNTVLDISVTVANSVNYTANSGLRIGSIGGGHEVYKGTLDDVGFWNRALTQQEIVDLYNASNPEQTVVVITPNGGENWQVGTSHNITWTSSNVTNVKLEYTTNNGTNWSTVNASTPASAGTYAWTIPNTPSTQCKVRVSDASNSLTSDVSNATFTIQVPAGPGWVPISNPQYNMSIIANLYFGNQLTTNSSDILGAFVGNECRGIASPNGSGLIFLSAGSNVQTGDTLTFRAWKSSTQEVRLLPDRIVFQNLGEVGTLTNPYRFEDGPGWVPATNQQYNMSIIGQLYFDNILSTNTGDVIGAFVGTECRGVASPGTNGTLFLIVSSNIQTGDTVRFRGWRSSTMATEPISQTMIFQNMAEIGTLTNPFRFDAGMRTVVYSFGAGYNWMSVNVNPGSMGVNSLFVPPKIAPAPNDRITGQTSFCVWDGTQWLGSLSTIDPKLSYVMKLTTAQVCTLQGLPVTLTPINFGAGYTWGGFYPQTAMPINTALANITPAPQPNDRVISQSAFAVWDGSQWLGSLTTLTPGKGYKFKFTNACVLTYPAGVKTEEIKVPEKVVTAPNWVPLPNLQYNMSIIAKVQIENGPPPVYSTNANDILGAFVVVGVDTQCRGTASPIGTGLYFLTVGSNVQSGETVIFKYYNQQNDLIKAIPDVITFLNMGEIGTLGSPQIYNGGPVPVELTSFTGMVNKNRITLSWTTSTEKNNKGFEVERKTDKGAFSKISFVEGSGTTTENRSYSFTDKSPASGTNIYRLRQVDYDGTSSYSNEIEVVLEIPKEYSLSQNYPNPFNPSTVISYQLPEANHVSIKVYDMIGNDVATLINEVKEAGYHTVTFNAENISTGVYFYQIKAGEFVSTKKLVLIK